MASVIQVDETGEIAKAIKEVEQKETEEDTKEAEDSAECPDNNLYYYLKKHSEIFIKLAYNYTARFEKNENFFEITLPSMVTYNLYRNQGYICVQRTLKICDTCHLGTSPLDIDTYISGYYTETYQDKNKNKTAVILPFNRFGQFLAHQKPNLEIQGTHYCQDLMHNAQDAKNILMTFLEKKAHTYFALCEELCTFGHDLITEYYQGNPESYITRVQKFQEMMDSLDLYEDSATKVTFPFIQERVNHLQMVSVKSNAQSIRNKCAIILECIYFHERTFDKTCVSKNRTSLENKIAIFQQVYCLRYYLTELAFLTDLGNVEYRQMLDRIRERIAVKTGNTGTFLELLNDCFDAGDLEAFKSLFPYQDYYVLVPELLTKWVAKLVYEQKNPAVLKGRIAICDFLFEHSNDYRHFILMDHLNIKLEHDHVSLVLLALLLENFDAFSMLLQQGYPLDKEGRYHENQFVSLLKHALFLQNKAHFIQLLLDHQVPIDAKTMPRAAITTLSDFSPLSNVSHLFSLMEFNIEDSPSDLLLAWRWQAQSVSSIQERTDPVHLALTLSHMVLNTENVKFAQEDHPKQHGIVCVQINDLLNIKKNDSAAPCRWLKILIYSVMPLGTQAKHDKTFDFIQSLVHALDMRFLNNRMQGLHAAINSLAQQANNLIHTPGQALCYYFACILLITEKKEVKEEEMYQVMQYYCKMADLYTALHQDISSQSVFIKACTFVCHSAYSANLQKTPEYHRAVHLAPEVRSAITHIYTLTQTQPQDEAKPHQKHKRK